MIFHQWLTDFYQNRKEQQCMRLGQAFCNDFIYKPFPELYYEKDEQKAVDTISKWLYDHNYLTTLPRKIGE